MRARQKVSRAGVELIKSFEGLRQTAARLPDGRWTIGYGHTFSAREGARVTQEDADALLRFDLLPIVDSLNNMVLVPLNQNQFDALVSFAFNIGVDNFAQSNVLKRINEGRMTEAALAMDAWRSAEFNGQTYVLAPLIRRRAAEKNLFLTPEDDAATAPSLLVRPMTDSQPDAGLRPTELDAPDRGGVLSAYPVGEPQAAPQPAYGQPIAPQPAVTASPYAAAYAPQPVAPRPAPEVAPTSFDRQVIDLGEVTPRPLPEAAPQPAAPQLRPSDISPYPPATGFSPYASPYAQPAPVQPVAAPVAAPAPFAEPPVVEMLPGGYAMPQPAAPQPAIIQPEPPAPTTYDAAFGSEPVMSPEVAAALARAQDEQRQREEAERQAQAQAAAMAAQAAARAAEEARIRELQQAEAARLEAQRQEQDRIDRARIEAERAEAARQEQMRFDQERQDRERAEVQRLEQERLQREAQERAERERAEMARFEQERLDRERAEQARLEQERLDREARDRAEQDARAAAAAAAPPSDDPAEKARKADAAAALMRLYSPYGGGPLGRPLNIGMAPLTPAPAPPSQPASDTVAPGPKPEAPQAAVPEPEAAQLAVENSATADRFPVAAEPAVFTPLVEPQNDEDDDIGNFKPFTPVMSAANLPAPVITALNPYARPLPKESVRENPIAPVAEVPPMAAVEMPAATMPATDTAPEPAAGLHWRERLQRPLPDGGTAPAAPVSARDQASFVRDDDQPQRQSNLRPAFMAEDDHEESWLHDGRVAMSVEEMEANTVSWWKMLTSTLWGICLSIVGIVSLGVAAGAYYKSKDLSVIRNGLQQDWAALSIISAVIGCVIVGISMWMMMRRLGGLDDKSEA